jgi:hypothetical protein
LRMDFWQERSGGWVTRKRGKPRVEMGKSWTAGKAVEEHILGAASSMPAKEWKKEKAWLLALLQGT